MTDAELLKSAGLYTEDRVTGEKGFNLAAVMLLGKDDVIRDVAPAYSTDALLRKVNVDRYDDRLIVETNLIESYDRLFEFAVKHLSDKFYLEDGKVRLSLRNIIAREMIVNTLMHREFVSAYQAKFVIEKDRMYVENANRARKDGLITPENLEPYAKNPLIASFFRNIGYSDKLGSGVRKLFNYSYKYSGADPEFMEGDIFRITVPLNDDFSWDAQNNVRTRESAENPTINPTINPTLNPTLKDLDRLIIQKIKENPSVTYSELSEVLGKNRDTIAEHLRFLQEKEFVERIGSKKNGIWQLIEGKTR